MMEHNGEGVGGEEAEGHAGSVPPAQHHPKKGAGGGLPAPPNVVAWLLKAVAEGSRLLGIPVPDDNLPQSEEERLALYQSALVQAAGEDYSDFHSMRCLHTAGRDKAGNRLVVVTGCNLPLWSTVDKERFRRFVYAQLDRVTAAPFAVVYLHTDVTDANKPCASWLMNSFEVLPSVWQHHLAAFYVVHPALTLRGALSIIPFWVFSPFARGDFVSKVQYIDRIEFLWDRVDPVQLQLPSFVGEHDRDLEEHALMDYGVVNAPTPQLQTQTDFLAGFSAPP